MESENLIQQGIKQKLISINEETNYITYIHQKKSRNYKNSEEQVQAIIFLKLVLEYNYPVEHIRQFVTVQMGSGKKEEITEQLSAKKPKRYKKMH